MRNHRHRECFAFCSIFRKAVRARVRSSGNRVERAHVVQEPEQGAHMLFRLLQPRDRNKRIVPRISGREVAQGALKLFSFPSSSAMERPFSAFLWLRIFDERGNEHATRSGSFFEDPSQRKQSSFRYASSFLWLSSLLSLILSLLS